MGSGPLERIETTELKDHRPWAERTGAVVLLLALAAGIAIALAAERRQRREVCRRAEENLASIAFLLSNRFNIWYTERAKAAAEAAVHVAATQAFAKACLEGRGNAELRQEIELVLHMGGFQAGGVVLPSGRWMEGTFCGNMTRPCATPDLRDPLRGAVETHGPLDHPHLDLAGLQLPGGSDQPQIVFLVEPLPAVGNLLMPQLLYNNQLSLTLVAREGPGAIVLWANPRSAMQRGEHLAPPLAQAVALSLEGVMDILHPEETEDSLAAVSYLATVHWGIVATIPIEAVTAPVRATAWLAWGVALLLFAFCIVTVAWLYRRSYWRTLREGAALSQSLVRRLLQAGEAERLYLSHELHDGLVNFLSAARMRHAASVNGLSLSEEQRLASEQTEQLLVESQKEARRFIGELRPPVLDGGRLISALQDLAAERGAEWMARHLSDDSLTVINEDVKALLYRIAQEALTNAAKHAEAKQVTISVNREGGHLVLEVRDDGRGFNTSAPREKSHFGLAVMTERAALAGAHLALISSPGAGTAVRVTLPLAVPIAIGSDTEERIL